MTAAVPDPRFHDQLAEESCRHRPNYTGEPWPWGSTYVGCVCGWLCGGEIPFEQHRVDALMPTIAAEVEARVQAAAAPLLAKVRAVEALAEELAGGQGSDLPAAILIRRALDAS